LPYVASALARTTAGWTGEDVDLDGVDDLESVADLLRDLGSEGPGPALLMLEEDEEYLAVVRVDGGGGLDEPRIFLSDRRAVQHSDLAAMLWEEPEAPVEDDDEESTKPVAEPVGDAALLSDVGTPADALLALVAEEGLLPGDVIAELCERAGCADVLETLREA
jgi:putative tRNA adenosine deaminase-associated protein